MDTRQDEQHLRQRRTSQAADAGPSSATSAPIATGMPNKAWQGAISANPGAPTLDPGLVPLAESIASIENTIVQMARAGYSLIVTGRLNAGDSNAKSVAQDELHNLDAILAQQRDVKEGSSSFSKDYLSNPRLIKFWVNSLSLIQQYNVAFSSDAEIGSHGVANWLVKSLQKVEHDADKSRSALIKAHCRGHIDLTVRAVMRSKWHVIEELVYILHERVGGQSIVPNWYVR